MDQMQQQGIGQEKPKVSADYYKNLKAIGMKTSNESRMSSAYSTIRRILGEVAYGTSPEDELAVIKKGKLPTDPKALKKVLDRQKQLEQEVAAKNKNADKKPQASIIDDLRAKGEKNNEIDKKQTEKAEAEAAKAEKLRNRESKESRGNREFKPLVPGKGDTRGKVANVNTTISNKPAPAVNATGPQTSGPDLNKAKVGIASSNKAVQYGSDQKDANAPLEAKRAAEKEAEKKASSLKPLPSTEVKPAPNVGNNGSPSVKSVEVDKEPPASSSKDPSKMNQSDPNSAYTSTVGPATNGDPEKKPQASIEAPKSSTEFKFSPEQEKWLGKANRQDPYIINRMPGEKPPMDYYKSDEDKKIAAKVQQGNKNWDAVKGIFSGSNKAKPQAAADNSGDKEEWKNSSGETWKTRYPKQDVDLGGKKQKPTDRPISLQQEDRMTTINKKFNITDALYQSVMEVMKKDKGSVPRNEKEKDLAKFHGDPKRITHGDVLKARGVTEEEVANDDIHPAGVTLLKQIKPQHRNLYKPHLTTDVFNGSYKDRTDILKAAEDAGHLKEDVDQQDEATSHQADQDKEMIKAKRLAMAKSSNAFTQTAPYPSFKKKKPKPMGEGIMDKVLPILTGGSDKDLLKKLQKDMGVAQTGQKPTPPVPVKPMKEAHQVAPSVYGQPPKLNPHGKSQAQIDDRMTSVGFIPGTRDHATAVQMYRAANPNTARPVSKPLPRSDIQGTDLDPLEQPIQQKQQPQQKPQLSQTVAPVNDNGGVTFKKRIKENKDTPGNSYEHQCAVHVKSESYGEGRTITTQHADPDASGNIAWYDVMFEHGIERYVPTDTLEILVSEMHMHSKKKKGM